jgi:hypothetical protein
MINLSRAIAFKASIVTFIAIALTPAAVMGASTPAASTASDPTERLGIWAGRWSYSERDFETQYSHAHSSTGTADCDWSPNRKFMICDYSIATQAPELP